MKVTFVHEISDEISKNSNYLTKIEDLLTVYFENKVYGVDINEILIRLICVHPQFDFFNKPKKKKYSKNKLFSYDIKLDFDEVLRAANDKLIKIFKRNLVDSIELLKDPRVEDFDLVGFRNDLIVFFDNLTVAIIDSYEAKPVNVSFTKEENFVYKPLEKSIFWEVIKKGDYINNKEWAEVLVEQLASKTMDEIIGFEVSLRDLLEKVNHYNILALQKIIEGSITDDLYLYFRCSIILLGEESFYKCLKSPDKIASELSMLRSDGEPLLYIADQAFTKKCETNLPTDVPTAKQEPSDICQNYKNYNFGPSVIQGKDWKEKDLPVRFPVLCKKFNFN